MAKSDRTTDTQFAALPYRLEKGELEVMLITSRGRGRWVIPKGWPMIGRKPHEAAEIEAFQEAGVKGKVEKKPIGTYAYSKRLPDGEDRLFFVVVFPLRVTLEAVKWRERAERKRVWFGREDAAALVEEGGLAEIIASWR
ncbi:NUDIX hydrolase [Acidisoma cellulosilytica]|uniref:NUDIX hydrolase n=1 Tax=Acidisoma cellulosilyticum TaxID=2802395 RepID=A0A963YZB9_9PROT|nr:NUDIX hydrolase [Acidisoma cellulosilyticum]MCB8879928.1 NUDIX hydrolase [Acidisoma cellulosilyticum]